MREIVAERLWLGNKGDLRDYAPLLDVGIAAVVDLAIEQTASALPRSMIYCRFPVSDGSETNQGVLRAAIETVTSLLRAAIPTVVVCGAGMSRSPAIAAAALSIVHDGCPEEWLKHVVSGQPHDISPQLWKDVKDACAGIRHSR